MYSTDKCASYTCKMLHAVLDDEKHNYTAGRSPGCCIVCWFTTLKHSATVDNQINLLIWQQELCTFILREFGTPTGSGWEGHFINKRVTCKESDGLGNKALDATLHTGTILTLEISSKLHWIVSAHIHLLSVVCRLHMTNNVESTELLQLLSHSCHVILFLFNMQILYFLCHVVSNPDAGYFFSGADTGNSCSSSLCNDSS